MGIVRAKRERDKKHGAAKGCKMPPNKGYWYLLLDVMALTNYEGLSPKMGW